MKATILVDNIPRDEISGEWGLSIFIKYNEKHILLDTGASELFLENAKKLGVDLKSVDFAVLSHAHYDHANGMEAFFQYNDKAAFYLRHGSAENCYMKKWLFHKYIGLPKNILKDYPERIVFAQGDTTLCPGVFLIPHKTSGLSAIGRKNHMYIRSENHWLPDDFAHEQSLVFDTADGLVIFNSCSHGGAATIIREVQATFPQKKIKALIGGFHLYNKKEAEVRAFADDLKKTDIQTLYTGHCTGEKAYAHLKEKLGDQIHRLYAGLQMEF